MRFLIAAVVACVGCGSSGVSREVGARCESANDCDDRCLPPSNDYPGGICTLDCQSSNECPDDTHCVDKESGVCLFTCNFTEDCSFLGADWTCAEQNLRQDQNQKVKVCIGN
jgi:hypothetical protein